MGGKRFTLQVSENTHKNLVRVLSRLQMDGKLRNFDDVIKELIKTWMNVKEISSDELI